MRILKFTLSGETAFFKKPEVNTYLYFTYGNIHKVALLGLLGAILGYEGYNQQGVNEYPQFYQRLKELRVSVVPKSNGGFLSKKVQIFNNSVGYASTHTGGNLIVKEQWLENPAWDIYIDLGHLEGDRITEYIMGNKAVYLPYLGKNDHTAKISNGTVINGERLINSDYNVASLVPQFSIDSIIIDDEDEEENYFKYQEMLPVELEDKTNMYSFQSFMYTNMRLRLNENAAVYRVEESNIIFY